jgi:hypothetical protein
MALFWRGIVTWYVFRVGAADTIAAMVWDFLLLL